MAESKKEDYSTININSLQCSFENIMRYNFSVSPNCCIFRTPTILYRHNEAAYKPNAFSFGPLHHGKQLEFTQKIKWDYLQGLLGRSTCPEKLYSELVQAISSVEAETRNCYAESIGLTTEKFVEILLLDGCFISELFRKDAKEELRDPNDPIFTIACLQEYLNHDLILLENQIPWLVLERLFTLTKLSPNESLIKLALDFFGNLFSSKKPSVTENHFQERKIEIKHILDLLRHSLLLPLSPDKLKQKDGGWEPLPCATKLKQAGIKFEKEMRDTILDINFRNGVLKIPPLLIQETTETILRNLISFEQSYPNHAPIITSFAKLMDDLVDTENDVEILAENDSIDNWLKSQDAKQFFNKLYHDTFVKQFFYHDICHQMNKHRKRWWPRLRFFYLHNFTTPLALVSQVVGAILLILTFLQTLYSILGVVGDKKS
ncbi:hypothetical protein Pint_02967 [Pistacia integerrima]|uniref:Uncharacterized protein n=1 Tax=Pistacia integerrima TaxID=434235 RepID=A0ACC0ZQ73_9ROSI|nr:hypothetical protein Pint_02967 [Pistacia integerrima]